jgi:hypothetical protein
VRRAALLVTGALALGACGGDDGDDADRVDGDGYTYEVPGGWDDRSESAGEISAAGFQPDTIVADDPMEGFTPSVNVVRETSLADDVDVNDYVRLSRRNLSDPEALGQLGLEGFEPRLEDEVREGELDGEQSSSFDYTADQQGKQVAFRQVYAIRDGTAYVVTYTTLRDDFDDGTAALDEVIDSWEWED